MEPSKAASSRLSALQQEICDKRALLERLRSEGNIDRMATSEAIAELTNYIQSQLEEDKLVTGFANPKDNPLLEKGKCVIS